MDITSGKIESAQYYKKTGLDVIWNSVENILDNVDVNSNVFWAAGKIFALKEQNAPVAMIDTDFIVPEEKIRRKKVLQEIVERNQEE